MTNRLRKTFELYNPQLPLTSTHNFPFLEEVNNILLNNIKKVKPLNYDWLVLNIWDQMHVPPTYFISCLTLYKNSNSKLINTIFKRRNKYTYINNLNQQTIKIKSNKYINIYFDYLNSLSNLKFKNKNIWAFINVYRKLDTTFVFTSKNNLINDSNILNLYTYENKLHFSLGKKNISIEDVFDLSLFEQCDFQRELFYLTKLYYNSLAIKRNNKYIYEIPITLGIRKDRNNKSYYINSGSISIGCSNQKIYKNFKKVKQTILSPVINNIISINNSNRIISKSTNSAISAIMSRNMSHNIGSHALADLIGSDDYIPQHEMNSFLRYIQNRMDFIAQITTEIPQWTYPVWFSKELMRIFYENYILLDRINVSEGLRAYDWPENWQEGRTRGKIIFRTGITENSELRTANSEQEKDNKEENSEQRTTNPKHQTSNIKHQTSNFSWIVNEFNEGEPNKDIQLAIPGGIVGYHAFYSILENVMRNSAKHGYAARRGFLSKERNENSDIIIIKKENNSYRKWIYRKNGEITSEKIEAEASENNKLDINSLLVDHLAVVLYCSHFKDECNEDWSCKITFDKHKQDISQDNLKYLYVVCDDFEDGNKCSKCHHIDNHSHEELKLNYHLLTQTDGDNLKEITAPNEYNKLVQELNKQDDPEITIIRQGRKFIFKSDGTIEQEETNEDNTNELNDELEQLLFEKSEPQDSSPESDNTNEQLQTPNSKQQIPDLKPQTYNSLLEFLEKVPLRINVKVKDEGNDYVWVKVWSDIPRYAVEGYDRNNDYENQATGEINRQKEKEEDDKELNDFHIINDMLRKSFIDNETGKLRQENWGMAELKICAGYLQQRSVTDIGGEGHEIIEDYNGQGDILIKDSDNENKDYPKMLIKAIPVDRCGHEITELRPENNEKENGGKAENDKQQTSNSKPNSKPQTTNDKQSGMYFLGYKFWMKKPKEVVIIKKGDKRNGGKH